MKSILKKVTGIAVAATLAFGMIGCSNPSEQTPPASPAGPDYSKCVVGDFILKDGTVLSKDTDLTPEQKQNVATVIVRAAEKGKPALGVGIVHSEGEWCKDDASGDKINIEKLRGSNTSGYIDGSDSWELLVAACDDLKSATPEEFETIANKYPAFNFCRKYGETHGLERELAEGWYLPTLAEFYTIYINKETVEASLEKAGGDQFGIHTYWTCCQSSSETSTGALVFQFNNGILGYTFKSQSTYIRSVKAFN